jgi:hypothetical protein
MTYLRVYLKVCEACGGLWFRRQDRMDIYCAACASKLSSFPRMLKRRRGRPCKQTIQPTPARGGVQ